MTTIEQVPETALIVAPLTPMDLIQRASAQGASIEQMTQLFELKLRVEADEARKAFFSDFTAFKSEAISIVKNVEIKDGPLKGKRHADLFGVISAVTPALSKHRLSFRYETPKDDPAWIEVACVLSHELGHEIRERKGGPPDTGPGRNAIQARISTSTYLERVTLLGVLGLAAKGMDDDGRASGAVAGQASAMPESQLLDYLSTINAAENADELKSMYFSALKAAEAAGDQAAKADIIAATNQRKKQFKGVA